MTHLDALQLNLSNERMRLAAAKSEGERELRSVWIAQLEKEIAGEISFVAASEMTADEIAADLGL